MSGAWQGTGGLGGGGRPLYDAAAVIKVPGFQGVQWGTDNRRHTDKNYGDRLIWPRGLEKSQSPKYQTPLHNLNSKS